MGIKIWLDDIRPMPEQFNLHLKTAQEAISAIRRQGVVAISFDHDLGEELTGYDVAKEIERLAYTGELRCFPQWQIHSANPVGAQNIRHAMDRASKEFHHE